MITSPHDHLFRHTFSQPEHAAGLLRSVLPDDICRRIDLGSLRVVSGSFVDAELAGRQSDLLFSARFARRPALVYTLLEHQSTVEALLPLRMLRYLVSAWEGHVHQHPRARRLPVVIPVVLHHSRTGWTAGTSMQELYDVDRETLRLLGEHAVRLRLVLEDISHADQKSLRGRPLSPLGKLVLFCLVRGREPARLVRELVEWSDVAREVVRGRGGRLALGTVFRYVLGVSRQPDARDRLVEAAREMGKEALEAYMTAAEMLVAEGMEKGLAKGRVEGRVEGRVDLLLKLLTARFGCLPASAHARVLAASDTDLYTWAGRVLEAATLGEVLDGPSAGRRRRPRKG